MKDIDRLGIVFGATPDGRAMPMYLYLDELLSEPHPQAEIEEIAWMSKEVAKGCIAQIAPMTPDQVFPFLEAQKVFGRDTRYVQYELPCVL